MVHFAPAHPGSLSVYDPTSDRDVALYPPAAVREATQDAMVDRRFEALERLDPGHLAMTVIEQGVTLRRDNTGSPSGPSRAFRIVCDLTGPVPRCDRQPSGR